MRPAKVLLFIACVLACLAALCIVLPHRLSIGEQELRWLTLAEVMGEEEAGISPIDSIALTDTLPLEALPLDTLPSLRESAETRPAIPHVTVDSTTDSRVFLRAFYASLEQADTRVVRVLHYGDSQIEEDRITQQIREVLQSRYGGSGVGLMPLAQTIPTLTTRQELRMSGRYVSPQQGPQRYLVYGPKRDQRKDGLYGPMGQVAYMSDSLVSGSEEITAICHPLQPTGRYERWQIFADSTVHYALSGDTVTLTGRGGVYGLSQESKTGIIVDNIPMRGCIGLVFNKIDSTQLATFYREQNVHLIIMQFGGNAIPSNKNPGTIQAIVTGLRQQVRYLRTCAPDASILFIGPSDMLTQTDGEWQTYPMVPYMDRLLRKMALEEQIAYFSLYHWMGGSGSMARWQEAGLAGSDGVHFYRSGARKAGNAVVNWMLEGMTE